MPDYPQRLTFKPNAHINYFFRCLRALPTEAEAYDSNRMTIAYFCFSALDLLGALHDKTTEEQRNGWIEWIWAQQAPTGGFRGSPYMTTENSITGPAHLPSTYTALLNLALLRAPLDRLNIPGIISFLRACQAPDGSFAPLPNDDYLSEGFQSDARMVYCACAVASMIDDFGGVDAEGVRRFVGRCRTWEGGYASQPGGIEAQGGTTYCSLAALSLLPPSPSSPTRDTEAEAAALRWLVSRQIGGFQGRPGKLEDVCYSFWCGGAMSILGHASLLNRQADKAYLVSAQFALGGFGKEPEDFPDPFHSYLGLAALSLSHSPAGRGTTAEEEGAAGVAGAELGLKELDARWNVSVETADWLRREVMRVKTL
ncbi:hypothetical protein IAT38_007697 [Cryptococcus sp. DSM 104549]